MDGLRPCPVISSHRPAQISLSFALSPNANPGTDPYIGRVYSFTTGAFQLERRTADIQGSDPFLISDGAVLYLTLVSSPLLAGQWVVFDIPFDPA